MTFLKKLMLFAGLVLHFCAASSQGEAMQDKPTPFEEYYNSQWANNSRPVLEKVKRSFLGLVDSEKNFNTRGDSVPTGMESIVRVAAHLAVDADQTQRTVFGNMGPYEIQGGNIIDRLKEVENSQRNLSRGAENNNLHVSALIAGMAAGVFVGIGVYSEASRFVKNRINKDETLNPEQRESKRRWMIPCIAGGLTAAAFGVTCGLVYVGGQFIFG